MDEQQEAHLEEVLGTMKSLVSTKYRAGQKEHGGNLFDLTTLELIDEAIMEWVDQGVYLLTARDNLTKFKNQFNVRP